MKKRLFLIAACVAVVLFWLFWAGSCVREEEGANVFNSSVYPAYRQALIEKIRTSPNYAAVMQAPPAPFTDQVRKLIADLQIPPDRDADGLRAAHLLFVHNMRKAVQMQKEGLSDAPSKALLTEVANWVFLGSDLRGNYEQLMQQYVGKDLNGESWTTYVATALPQLRKDSRFLHSAEDPAVDDAYLYGNLPSKMFVLDNPQKTEVVRMANPVINAPFYLAPFVDRGVQPEFMYFLSQRQAPHLYVNLMKRKGLEAYATRQLEQLDKEFTTLYVVSLDKNSDFYRQDGIYHDVHEAALFKAQFLKQMNDPKGDFFWSAKWEAAPWSQELEDLIEGVHQHYFGAKAELGRDERTDFIEIAYVRLLDRLVAKAAPATMNITCRQAMDRAPSLTVLWQASSVYHAQPKNDRQLAAQFLVPPLLIHNRPSHPSRLQRLLSAERRLGQEDL